MAMDKSAADAYVYAKSSAILSKAYVFSKAGALFSVKSLHELWALLFKKEAPPVPETLLAKEIEVQAQKNFLMQYDSLLANYSSPPELLIALAHFYEYENLKIILSALSHGEKMIPELTDVSPFSIINTKKWPDIKLMTEGTELDWASDIKKETSSKDSDYIIDTHYVKKIWASLQKTDKSCREVLTELIGGKLSMDNAVWALRLKLYYGMTDEEIFSNLAYSDNSKNLNDVLVQEAVKVLSFAPDDYEAWRKWKSAFLLNPYEEGSPWKVDPRWIYNSYRKFYVLKARRLFHLYPFTDCPLVCWFIIKRNELENIRTASESLRLSIDTQTALKFAGLTED
ncbi:MAG: V-type ATPase subunit [Treponema sp.]|nr:V-type ATPase subunit [Treponema sp.]